MKLETLILKSGLITKEDLNVIERKVLPENKTKYLLDVLYNSLGYEDRKAFRKYGYKLELHLKDM